MYLIPFALLQITVPSNFIRDNEIRNKIMDRELDVIKFLRFTMNEITTVINELWIIKQIFSTNLKTLTSFLFFKLLSYLRSKPVV